MNGLLHGHILGCGQQADAVAQQLSAGKYDAQWTFAVNNMFPIPHQYGVAQSSDPNDPQIVFDPYFNTVQQVYPTALVNSLINVNKVPAITITLQ